MCFAGGGDLCSSSLPSYLPLGSDVMKTFFCDLNLRCWWIGPVKIIVNNYHVRQSLYILILNFDEKTVTDK